MCIYIYRISKAPTLMYIWNHIKRCGPEIETMAPTPWAPDMRSKQISTVASRTPQRIAVMASWRTVLPIRTGPVFWGFLIVITITWMNYVFQDVERILKVFSLCPCYIAIFTNIFTTPLVLKYLRQCTRNGQQRTATRLPSKHTKLGSVFIAFPI